MPNWTANLLRVYGDIDELKRFRDFAKEQPPKPKTWEEEKAMALNELEEGKEKRKPNSIDFNNFIPYPENFKERDNKSYRMGALMQKKRKSKADLKELRKLKKELKEDFKKNYAKIGKEKNKDELCDGYNLGGYEWANKFWGTKWNADCINEGENFEEGRGKRPHLFYFFRTAWSCPFPVIKKMSEMFPKLTFNLRMSYEGEYGNGQLILKGNEELLDKWNPKGKPI